MCMLFLIDFIFGIGIISDDGDMLVLGANHIIRSCFLVKGGGEEREAGEECQEGNEADKVHVLRVESLWSLAWMTSGTKPLCDRIFLLTDTPWMRCLYAVILGSDY